MRPIRSEAAVVCAHRVEVGCVCSPEEAEIFGRMQQQHLVGLLVWCASKPKAPGQRVHAVSPHRLLREMHIRRVSPVLDGERGERRLEVQHGRDCHGHEVVEGERVASAASDCVVLHARHHEESDQGNHPCATRPGSSSVAFSSKVEHGRVGDSIRGQVSSVACWHTPNLLTGRAALKRWALGQDPAGPPGAARPGPAPVLHRPDHRSRKCVVSSTLWLSLSRTPSLYSSLKAVHFPIFRSPARVPCRCDL
jgi:hypothetical protein